MSLLSLIAAGSRRRFHHSAWLCCALLLGGAAQEVKASGFVGYYAFSNSLLVAPASFGNFILTDHRGLPGSFGAGTAVSPDFGTLVLTGINDGSFNPGWTGLTILAGGTGLFQFNYSFSTLDDPQYEYAGYILGGSLMDLADTDGQSGAVSVPVVSGEVIGFFAGGDDQGGLHGVLTITAFSAPVPEPATFQLLLFAGAAATVPRLLRRTRRRRWLKGLAAAIAAAACSSMPALAQQIYYTGVNVTGALVLTGVVNAQQQSQTYSAKESVLHPDLVESEDRQPARRPVAEALTIPPRRLHSPAFAAPFAEEEPLRAMATTPTASALSIVQSGGASGFNALSHRDQMLANGLLATGGHPFSIEPPSPSIAAGNGYVLEGVNTAIQVYGASGAPLLPAPLASNQLFGLGPARARDAHGADTYGVYLTDMHVYFDQGMSRWFVMQWAQDNDSAGNSLNSSHLYIAVSQTADPTATYNIYVMNTTDPSRPQCPCVPDYPQFGSDQYGVHISWNEFSTYTYTFVDVSILTLSKASLNAGAVAPTAFQILIPYVTGYEFSLRPATTPPGAANAVGTGGLEFFVSTLSSFALGNQIALWAMEGTSSLATQNPSLTLTRVLVPTMSYATPNVAAQRAGPTPYGSSLNPPAPLEYLDGGDTRVQSLSYAAGFLYLTLQTGVNDANGAWVVGGAYIVLSPTYRGGALAARVMQQGYLFVNGYHLLRPAIAVNAQGAGAIAVTLVGSDWYPSAAYIPFVSLTTPSTLQVAAAGAFPEDGFSGYPTGGGYGVARWGDYNGAVAASDGSIWMVVQYIGNYARTDYANWNTYVVHSQF